MRLMGATLTQLALFSASRTVLAHAQRYSSGVDQAYTIESDLQSLLHDTTLSQEKELSETLAWYQKLPSEGSCVQLAAMKLMSECKLLDNPSDFAKAHPDLYLDDVKVEYAVKLANCEIVGAQPDQPFAPQHCQVFLPTADACIKRSWNPWGRAQYQPSHHLPCYPQASENDLHRCLKTLRSSPQYWTSFSNAKFRAVNMCQLSRHAIEREKTLQLHKNLTHVTFRVQASLRRIQLDFEAFQSEFKQSTGDIRESADRFKKFADEAWREAQHDRENAKQEIHALQVELASVHEMIISNISTYNARFDRAVDASIQRAMAAVRDGQSGALANIGAELATFYRALRAEGSDLITSLNIEIQRHHEKALLALQIEHGAMMHSYSLMSDNLDHASRKVDVVNAKVDDLDNKTDKSLVKMGIIDDRLDGLGTKFKTVERAFMLLDSLFHLGTICLVVAAAVVAACVLCVITRALPNFTWYLVGIFATGGILYRLKFYELGRLRTPTPLAIESLPYILGYAQLSQTQFWAVLAAVCFFVAAFLPKLNVYCEETRNRIAVLSCALFNHLQPMHRRKLRQTSAAHSEELYDHRLPIYTVSSAGSPHPKYSICLLQEDEDEAVRIRLASMQRAQSVA